MCQGRTSPTWKSFKTFSCHCNWPRRRQENFGTVSTERYDRHLYNIISWYIIKVIITEIDIKGSYYVSFHGLLISWMRKYIKELYFAGRIFDFNNIFIFPFCNDYSEIGIYSSHHIYSCLYDMFLIKCSVKWDIMYL